MSQLKLIVKDGDRGEDSSCDYKHTNGQNRLNNTQHGSNLKSFSRNIYLLLLFNSSS